MEGPVMPMTLEKLAGVIVTALLVGAFQKFGERLGGAVLAGTVQVAVNSFQVAKQVMRFHTLPAESLTATVEEPIKPVEKFNGGFCFFNTNSMFWAVMASLESDQENKAENQDEEKAAKDEA